MEKVREKTEEGFKGFPITIDGIKLSRWVGPFSPKHRAATRMQRLGEELGLLCLQSEACRDKFIGGITLIVEKGLLDSATHLLGVIVKEGNEGGDFCGRHRVFDC